MCTSKVAPKSWIQYQAALPLYNRCFTEPSKNWRILVATLIQDLINAWVKLYFAKDEEGLKKFNEVTLQLALDQLEKRLVGRGGQYFVGNNLTWADIIVFMYLGDLPKEAYEKYPKLINLYERVGALPNIKAWVENRPKTNL